MFRPSARPIHPTRSTTTTSHLLFLQYKPTFRGLGPAPVTRETTVWDFARSQGVIHGPSVLIPPPKITIPFVTNNPPQSTASPFGTHPHTINSDNIRRASPFSPPHQPHRQGSAQATGTHPPMVDRSHPSHPSSIRHSPDSRPNSHHTQSLNPHHQHQQQTYYPYQTQQSVDDLRHPRHDQQQPLHHITTSPPEAPHLTNYLTSDLPGLDWGALDRSYPFPHIQTDQWDQVSPVMDHPPQSQENPHFHSILPRSQSNSSNHQSSLANGLSQDPMMAAYLMGMQTTTTDQSQGPNLEDSQSWSSSMTRMNHQGRQPQQIQPPPDSYRRYPSRTMSAHELPQEHFSLEIRNPPSQMRRHPMQIHTSQEIEDRQKAQGDYYRHLEVAVAYQSTQIPPYFHPQDPPTRNPPYLQLQIPTESHHLHHRSSAPGLLEMSTRDQRRASPLATIKYESPPGLPQLE